MKRLNLIIIFLLILCSCASENIKLDYKNENLTIQYSQQRTYMPEQKYTKEESLKTNELIQDLSSSRSMKNLKDIKVLWSNSDIFIEFYFSDKVETSDIQSAMDYFTRTIILEKPYPMAPDEISGLIHKNELRKKTLRIYIDGNLFSQTIYEDRKENGLETNYFENHLISYGFRKLKTDSFVTLKLQDINNINNIDVYDTLKPFTYIVSVDISSKNDKIINKIFTELYDCFSDDIQTLLNKNVKELIINLSENKEIVFTQGLILNDENEIIKVETVWR